ncbi:response regulator [Algoriphagus sp. CAU 1675]|uniref:response regulator n=1 Tax=Algoriphagus sp. CAU 1675 TaxID=3032597 RepID=UPI0023DCAF4F|nr:response regulator [Algoriphagus sp. CAU 1675]MDF2157062.1 response regulator [Algoriphagus sp. CAU 1675]
MEYKPIKILLVEDNEGDIFLTKEALSEARIKNVTEVVRDGEQAISLLENRLKKNPDELPDLIILDINLPKKNGHEVLMHLKKNKGLTHVPIIILSTSFSDQDVLKAYQEHANCYIVKPIDVFDFMQVVSKIEDFWFNIIKYPKIK